MTTPLLPGMRYSAARIAFRKLIIIIIRTFRCAMRLHLRCDCGCGLVTRFRLRFASRPGLALLFFTHLPYDEFIDFFLAWSLTMSFDVCCCRFPILLLVVVMAGMTHLPNNKRINLLLRIILQSSRIILSLLRPRPRLRLYISLVLYSQLRQFRKGHCLARIGDVYPRIAKHIPSPIVPFRMRLEL